MKPSNAAAAYDAIGSDEGAATNNRRVTTWGTTAANPTTANETANEADRLKR
jgi:hypothetical protein